MLGSRLARRIVLPLLLLHAALFGLLAFGAFRIADHSVARELESTADRVARTLDDLRVAPEHRAALLPPLARLLGCDLVVGSYATQPGWTEAQYRVLDRSSARGPDRYRILFRRERIEERHRDALSPILWTGGVGLLVALLLGVLVARTIARPVKRLALETRAFAEGRYEGASGARGPGEVGDLQDAFASMVQAIREGERRLEESARLAALGRLAGGIAHELRNPLTAIRMAVETATGAAGPHQEEARRIALGEIDRLDRTLRELLDFVRPRVPRRSEFAVADLLADVVALLKPQCDHLRVDLGCAVEGAPRLLADYDRVKQALLNLVLNGAQAQPEGGAVRLRGGEGFLEVSDDGPGIPPDERASILEPFVTTKSAGIGLGLAVVKQVADEHGAELEIRTGEGGTAFTLRFPR